jgi:PAS domain S-box-containing protein
MDQHLLSEDSNRSYNLNKLQELTERLTEKDEALRLRNIYLHGLVQIQTLLLLNNNKNIYADVAKLLGDITNDSRIFIYKNIDSVKAKIIASWMNKNTQSLFTPGQDIIDYQTFSDMYDVLDKGMLYNEIVEDLPDSEAKFYLMGLGVKSIIISPIRVKGKLWGFIGIDNLEDSEKWGQLTSNLLSSIAFSLQAYIRNADAEKILYEKEIIYRKLFEETGSAMILIDIATGEEIVIDINKEFERILSIEKAEIAGKRLQDVLPAADVEVLKNYLQSDLSVPTVPMKCTLAHTTVNIEVFISKIPGTTLSFINVKEIMEGK